MMNDAAASGNGFALSSAYRSYANQVATYNNWVAINGSAAAADTVSARPGYSEHQTGLAADLKVGSCVLECFGGTTQYAWLQAHASDYGFIERYPDGLTSITGYSPEAWHWRYVGPITAKDLKTKGIQTLEEYFGISGGDYAG
jgi:D-alanyl-D-alanine carboxypeptidase